MSGMRSLSLRPILTKLGRMVQDQPGLVGVKGACQGAVPGVPKSPFQSLSGKSDTGLGL
jgi:hypothetical protein